MRSLWLAIGVSTRLEWAIDRHFFVGCDGAVVYSTPRITLVFPADQVAIPQVGWTAAAGSGVQF
jgi:hypothetical protein